MYRKTYALIDCNVIENNVKAIIKEYSSYKYYFGVVKANAYGHELGVIKYMLRAGINYLAVATLEEGLEVRKRYSFPSGSLVLRRWTYPQSCALRMTVPSAEEA